VKLAGGLSSTTWYVPSVEQTTGAKFIMIGVLRGRFEELQAWCDGNLGDGEKKKMNDFAAPFVG
jgi:hypothetical protein